MKIKALIEGISARHMQFGKISYLVFPLLNLSFITQMSRLVQSDAPQFLFFPLSDCISLILFYSLAIYHKKVVHQVTFTRY